MSPVVIPKAVVDEGCQPWRLSLVGKFLGRASSLEKVHHGLSEMWRLQTHWEFSPMAYGYFIFRFTSQSNLDTVLSDGPWVLDDVVLTLGQ